MINNLLDITKKSIKIAISFLIEFIVSVLLHNFISGLFGIEEPVFFILALISAAGLVISVIYLVIALIINIFKKKK